MSEEQKLFLEKLKELNKKKSINIFLPSFGKKEKFLPFTLKQQKTILGKLPTDSTGIIMFHNIFNEIIQENTENRISLHELNLFDRISIILHYRASSLGNVIESDTGKINLNDVLKKLTDYDYKKIFEEITVSLKDISATLCVPNLIYDSKVNKEMAKKIKNITSPQEAVSELFTSEILKYIKSINIFDSNINLYELSYVEKLEVIENLPGTFVKKIFDFIQKIKELENELTTIDGIKLDISNDLFA